MVTSLLSVLPRVLLVVFAASETGLCKVPCPDECAGSAVVLMENGTHTIRGRDVPQVIHVVRELQTISSKVKLVFGVVGSYQMYMPKDLKITIQLIAKKYPEVWKLILKLLMKFNPKGLIVRPTRKPRPPPQTTVSPVKTTKPPRRTRRPKPRTTRPVKKVPSPPKEQPKPIETLKIPLPEPTGPLTDIGKGRLFVIPPEQKNISPKIRGLLELMVNFPNFFSLYYITLIDNGVKIPQFEGNEIKYVLYHNKTIKLPKPIVVAYTVTINGKTFQLPAQAKALVQYVYKHPARLLQVVTVLSKLRASFSTGKKGRILSFELFGQIVSFPREVGTTIMVGRRRFVLPEDLPLLLVRIKDNPAAFFKIRMLLQAFGVRFQDSNSPDHTDLIYLGRIYYVRRVNDVRIEINNKTYIVPRDLEEILNSPDVAVVGKLLAALQRAKVFVEVHKKTGSIQAIRIDGVTIPFPVSANLRLRLYGKTYTIPHDLRKIISVLEDKGMPSSILSILYSHYGVIPVRGPDNVVVALSFNGRKYAIKAQPMTTIILGGVKILLPRDNDKMISLVMSGKVSVVEFMQAVQRAGYKFLPEVDGALHKIQKGTEIINLPLEIRLIVEINGVTYRMPSDLPRLVKLLRGFGPTAIKQIKGELEKLGVGFTRKGKLLIIVFNGVTYKVQLKSTSLERESQLTMILNNKKFTLPKQLNALVAYATSLKALGIKTLLAAFKSQKIKVNQSASGEIISVVIDGKVYKVRSKSSSGEKNFRIIIRRKKYLIPRDVAKLSAELDSLQFSELIDALKTAGAKLKFDAQSYVTGFLFRGRLIRLPRKFRVMVRVDETGKEYRIPLDLPKVAKILSKGQWNWKAVRKALMNAGVKVPGGVSGGAIKKFSFLDKKFKVKK